MEFAGERHSPAGSAPFRIGREGDLIIDDNPYLHRRFLELRYEQGLWWIVNVGGQLSATVSDLERGLHAGGPRWPDAVGDGGHCDSVHRWADEL